MSQSSTTPVPSPEQTLPTPTRVAIVQALLQGQDTVAGMARQHGLAVATLLEWRAQGLKEGLGAGVRGATRRSGLPQASRLSGPC